ncbi:MAG: diguanylate cyclase [Deltaproteobacteria bacterium]|nr:diguanylate cyclase [Deltaproteobacteria bacterium]MBN2674756.1 diguanylate cyclase [Deltaproteobacteria bacterium]
MMTKRQIALLVDPDPVAIKFMTAALDTLGFEVHARPDLLDDLNWSLDEKPDILILDTTGSNISHIEFIVKFDSFPSHPSVPIVITSAHDRDAEVKRSFDAAVVKSTPKPIELPEFMRRVNKLMGWSAGRRVPKRAPAIIVEDVNTTAMIIQKLLDVLGVEAYICNSKEEFDKHIRVIYPEIISLDLYLPDGNGLEICNQVRAKRKMDELPIIVVSGNTEMDTVVECLRAGANDHISKPIVKEEFFARVSNVLKIRKLQKDLHDQQKQMEKLAFTDPLTTLFNRTYMDMAMQRELERTRRSGAPLGLLLIDLDFFKQVNDTHGHEIGDEVLREFGLLLKNKIRSYDVPCRYGGEEFCVLLPGSTAANVVTVAERIRKACETKTFSSKELKQTISIGTSVFPELSREHLLISDADKALYSAKQSGRNRTIVSLPK